MNDTKKTLNPLTLILVLSALFFVLFLMITGVLFFMKSPGSFQATSSQNIFKTGDAVAVIELEGVILDSKKFLKQFKEVKEDKKVKAIVVRLNSPGGAVAPSQEIYQTVKESDKPVIASMGSVAASGAYYVASGTQKIYANPGTITGSIGVIMEFVNLSKLYEWAKIQRYAIKTGKFKAVGADYKEMSPEEKALLQSMVDDVLGQFKKAVSEGRKISMKELDEIADGRIFSGQQALKVKLVDAMGSIDDAIKAAAEKGGIKGEPEVIYPGRERKKFLEYLMEEGDEESSSRAGMLGLLAKKILGYSPDQFAAQWQPGLYWLMN